MAEEVGSCCLDFQNGGNFLKPGTWNVNLRAICLPQPTPLFLWFTKVPLKSVLFPQRINCSSCLLSAAAYSLFQDFRVIHYLEAPTRGGSGLVWEFLTGGPITPRKEEAETLQTCGSSLCPLPCMNRRCQNGEMTLAAWSFHLVVAVRSWRVILSNKMFC